MNQLQIILEGVDLKIFYGEYNQNFKLLVNHFPKLKITGRDQIISVSGSDEDIAIFERKVKEITDYINKYNKLNDFAMEGILNRSDLIKIADNEDDVIVHGIGGKLIRAKSENLKKLVDLVDKNDMVFAVGPAGTGKTYTSVALAVRALKNKEVKRLILTRPAVEAGESLGFLPGDLKEKLDPYLQPLYDALKDMISHEKLASYLDKGIIEIAPLAFMRGRTLDDAFVILDEAQNTTHLQMKMFLTRMGENAKFIITGDPGQIDLLKQQKSGLKEAIVLLKNVKGIGFIKLTEMDVVRHKLVKKILEAYHKQEEINE
ncbi:PhoH family protein [Apibacter raozihei]|uniref:PhoH family protein n=1 Tax=Apibacter TaxID=1778601 RepID=UPI000FE39C81|nr:MULTISPECIES: PhoH family protein [Apibacter]